VRMCDGLLKEKFLKRWGGETGSLVHVSFATFYVKNGGIGQREGYDQLMG